MSVFEERLTEHQLHEALTRLRGAIEILEPEARSHANEIEPKGTLERALAVASWVEGLLGIADPILVPTGPLDQISDWLNGAAEAVPKIAEDETWVPSINGQLDSVVGGAQALIASTSPMSELTADIRTKLGRTISSRTGVLTRQLNTVRAALEDLQRETDQARDAATAADEQRAGEAQARMDELQQAIEAERQRVDQLVSNVQTEHQNAQSTRQSEHTDAQKTRDDAFAAAMERARADVAALAEELQNDADRLQSDLGTQAEDLISNLRNRSEAIMDNLLEVQRRVNDLYEIVNKTGTAGAFHEEARTQARAANAWRIVAVVFGIAAVAVAVVAAFVVDPDDFGWEQLTAKLAVTVGLGAIAAYAGRQSSRHREREELAKHLELDLTAIGPFLEAVESEDKKNDARTAFIERWMASRTTRQGEMDGQVIGLPPRDLVALLERLARGNGQ